MSLSSLRTGDTLGRASGIHDSHPKKEQCRMDVFSQYVENIKLMDRIFSTLNFILLRL